MEVLHRCQAKRPRWISSDRCMAQTHKRSLQGTHKTKTRTTALRPCSDIWSTCRWRLDLVSP